MSIILKMMAFLARVLSWRWAQKIGGALGLIWYYVIPIRRRTVMNNLALALPNQSDEHAAIARRAYRHFGISALELLRLAKMSREEVLERVHLHGFENYERALDKGRGVIVVTAHFGNFDLLACSQAARGVPLAIVSRNLHGGGVNKFWMKTRRSSGLHIFPDEGAGKSILKWLRSGKVLGLTVDQRTSSARGGILSDFMNRRVWTTTAPAKLALRTGAALLPVRVERRIDGSHDLFVEREIDTTEKNHDNAVELITIRINCVISGWVITRPDHWMWLHRRFVT